MSFWRRQGGGGGGNSSQHDDSKSSSSQNSQSEEQFGLYGQVRKAVESEKEIMKLLTDLGEDDFNRLMDASEEYLKARRETQQHEYEMKSLEEKKARSEHLKHAEEEQTKRQQLKQESKVRQMRTKGEEMRKLEEKKTEELKKRINYEQEKATAEEQKRELIRLEAKREFNRLDSERSKEQEALEQRQWQRDVELAKMKLAEKARLDKQNELDLGEFRLEQALKEHNATKDDKLKRDLELKKVEVEGSVQAAKIKWESLQNYFSGVEGRERAWNVGGLVVGSIATLYFFKTVQPVAVQGLKDYFFKPVLVSRSVKTQNSPVRTVVRRIQTLVRPEPPLPDVILEPKLQEKMKGVIEATRNTAKRKGLYGHMMLYGKPGTGKTLFAETLARESGLDFAVMSGPSFDQFETADAIKAIKGLFKWANRSRGLLLFVDEADSFLEDRSTLNPSRVTVLNEWLNQTGTESKKFMCVYETNRPEVLDPAVQSRITRSIEMPPPSTPEILRMLEQYIELYVIKELRLKAPVKEGETTAENETTETEKEKEKEKEKETEHHHHRRKGKEKEKTEEQKEEEEGMKLVGVNDHGYHREVTKFGLGLPEIARKLAAEHFVGRDVSNLCIAIGQTISASRDAFLSSDLVAEVVEEQIQKKRRENIYLATRAERISSLKRFDISQHV